MQVVAADPVQKGFGAASSSSALQACLSKPDEHASTLSCQAEPPLTQIPTAWA